MSETAEAERDAWRCRHRLLAEQFLEASARIRELEMALDESVKLQSHYAMLLNMHDGAGVEMKKPLRTYAVQVDGYSPVHFEAHSAAKARAKAYRALCDAGSRWSFHTFLIMSRVWLVGDWEPARDGYPRMSP